MKTTTFYFGSAIPGSSETITPARFREFLSAVVTPRYPAGLTWHQAHGQWQGPDGIVLEDCYVLFIVDSVPGLDSEICGAYCRTFNQDAVLTVSVDLPAGAVRFQNRGD